MHLKLKQYKSTILQLKKKKMRNQEDKMKQELGRRDIDHKMGQRMGKMKMEMKKFEAKPQRIQANEIIRLR